MGKDWTGNSNSTFRTLGASNHTEDDRERYDFYATTPRAAELLLTLEKFDTNIWECACGQGHLSKVFEDAGHNVKSTDLVDRGYGIAGVDFLGIDNYEDYKGDIITNPPYIYAAEFVERALRIIQQGNKVAMFLKLQFLESKGRKQFFVQFPPSKVYISSTRLVCAKNGDFESVKSSAVAYAWFIWEKGYKGDTILKWFN